MDVLLLVPGVPAGVFFVVAVALGLNPLRSAAWGAILGVIAFAGFMYIDTQDIARRERGEATWFEPANPPSQRLQRTPTFTPTDEQPAALDCSGTKNVFDQFDPGCPAANPKTAGPPVAPTVERPASNAPKLVPVEGNPFAAPDMRKPPDATARGLY